MLTRRSLAKSTLSLLAASRCAWALPALSATPAVRLHVKSGPPLAMVPPNFTGLGYEMSSVARPGLLSAENATYVRTVRGLGPGVLRAGGVVADFTRFSAAGTPEFEPKRTVITAASLRQLRGFLDAVDWSAIWSVNFGRGTLPEAIEEARAAAGILGPRLLALELGNEVENYSHGNQPLRPPPYTYADFRAQYDRWQREILAAVPGLRFAAPDTAASVEWVEKMAADAHGDVHLLTTHYYRGDQHNGTRAQLLGTDPQLIDTLERLRRASASSGIPWRMCEINSFFGGGRPGLSDTLAGALWTLDTMLLLASYGCAGVNMETGVNQLGFLSSYSPVRDDKAGNIAAGAPYYGMLAFALATAEAREMVPVKLETDGLNVTAYVLARGGRPVSAVLINKSPDQPPNQTPDQTPNQDVRISLRSLNLRNAGITRLAGGALDSGEGITLGGACVNREGRWASQRPTPLHDDVLLPPASAALIRDMARI